MSKKFTKLPAVFFTDKRLRGGMIKTAHAFYYFSNMKHGCIASNKTLAKRTHQCVDTIKTHLKLFEAYGYIIRERICDGFFVMIRRIKLAAALIFSKGGTTQPYNIKKRTLNIKKSTKKLKIPKKIQKILSGLQDLRFEALQSGDIIRMRQLDTQLAQFEHKY